MQRSRVCNVLGTSEEEKNKQKPVWQGVMRIADEVREASRSKIKWRFLALHCMLSKMESSE